MAKLTPLTSWRLQSDLEKRKIKIRREDRDEPFEVYVIDYVKAKGDDLRLFGYTTLTNETVLNVVEKILNREEVKDVISLFIKDDIVLENEA